MRASAAALPGDSQVQGIVYAKSFVLAVTAYTLISMARLHEIVPQLGPLRLGMLSALVVFFTAASAIRRDLVSEILRSPVGKGLGIVVLFVVISIPTAEWPAASFKYLRTIYYNAVLIFIAGAAVFADRRSTRIVITALVIDVAMAGLFSIFKAHDGRYEIGSTYDANETASLFVMTVPWAIYLLMTEKGLPRLAALAAIPACAIGLLQTGSRGGLLGAAALVPFLIMLSPPKRRGSFTIAVIVGSLVTGMSMGDQAIYRFRKAFDTTEYNYTTEDGRVEIWKRGLGYIKGSPILGLGMDGFQYKELNSKSNTGHGIRQAAAHNMYIQVGAELGVIGFGGFLAMLVGGQVLCVRARRRLKAVLSQGPSPDADREIVRVNMAQASLWSLMCTGFFLSLGYSSMVYFAVGACVGVWLSSRSLGADGPSGAVALALPRAVRGMRGWRSARPVPAGTGLHGLHTPQA